MTEKYKGVNLDTWEGFPNSVKPNFTTPQKYGRRHRLREYLALASMMRLNGKPLVIMTWQAAVLAMMTQMDKFGRLIYRDFNVSVTRQQGKSTILAVIVIHHMMTRVATIISIGGTVETSRIAFDITRLIIDGSPKLAKHFITGDRKIVCKLTGSTFTYRAPTVAASLGKSPTMILGDERMLLSDRHGSRALTALRNSQSAIPEPMFISTSTVGANAAWVSSWGSEWRRGQGFALEPSKYWETPEAQGFAFVHYGVKDTDDIFEPTNWSQAMPALADGLGNLFDARVDFAQHESNGELGEFAMYRLGLWQQGVDGSNAALNMETFFEMIQEEEVEFSEGEKVILGLDASMRNDHTVLTCLQAVADDDGRRKFKTLWRWVPEPGNATDTMPLDELTEQIRAAMTMFDAYLAFDPHLISTEIERMENREFRGRMIRIPQSISRMSKGANLVLQAVEARTYRIQKGDSIIEYAANATLKDNGLLAKPSRTSSLKVDGLISLAMAEYQLNQLGDRIKRKPIRILQDSKPPF